MQTHEPNATTYPATATQPYTHRIITQIHTQIRYIFIQTHRHFQRRHRERDTRTMQTFKIIVRPALELDGATMSYFHDV